MDQEVQSYVEMMEEARQKNFLELMELGKKITGKEPKMWKNMIGFGNLHYRYPSGHEGNMPALGLGVRKKGISLYCSYKIEQYKELEFLGLYSIGKGCIHIKDLEDIRMEVLESIIRDAIRDTLRLSFITVVE